MKHLRRSTPVPGSAPTPDSHDGPRGSSGSPIRAVTTLFATYLVLGFGVLSLSRLGLVLMQWDRVSAVGGLDFILLQGVRFDAVLLGMLVVAPGVLAPFWLAAPGTCRRAATVVRVFLSATLVFLVLLELATPEFLAEFDTRPNRLFFSYSPLAPELFATLWKAHGTTLGLALAGAPVLGWTAFRRLLPCELLAPIRIRQATALSLLFAVVCPLVIRSTFDHRPVNPSTVAYSRDPMVNTLPLSSGYTLLYALYESRLDRQGGESYGQMDDADAVREVIAESGIPASAFFDPDIPTLHRHVPTRPRRRPLSLVIVLEESLGAEFVGRLGGIDLTPRLDALADEGMWFESLYATGTRSVRGIEAVVTGFPPTPAPSVVKRPGSQRDFFTLGELLRRQGYETLFVYGGESHFDNMRRFFTGNGFARVLDENDFEEPAFVGSWGVSDEDLFARADAELTALGDRPFFALVFSSSNHSPFDFPDGGITTYDEPRATVENAVRYADWALGDFFRKAKESSYWDHTVFLVVADHNSRVFGAEAVPVERFHIPALFLGDSIAPQRVSTVASQIDLLPTALSLIGVEADTPSLGRDYTRESADPGRALFQYQDRQAYMEGGQVVVLQAGQPAAEYAWNGRALAPAALDEGLAQRALANLTWAQSAYRSGSYRLPPSHDEREAR